MKNTWIWLGLIAVIVVGGVLYFNEQQALTPMEDTQSEQTKQDDEKTTTTDDDQTQDTTNTSDNPGTSTDADISIKNPDTLVYATISDIDTLDPHFIYDTASGEVIFHVYDNLIAYDGPYTDRFVPMLATKVPSLDNGLIQENADGAVTLRFPIREGVKFHNGNDLTPEDVAFSFHRLMLYDRSAGPTWLVLSPLLGVNTILDLAKSVEVELNGSVADDVELKDLSTEALAATCQRVKQTVQVEDGVVAFHLPQAFPPFLSIISHSASWAAILDQQWVTENGDWDGNCANWVAYNDPQKENAPLYEIANGTGPFKFDHWDRATQELSMVRNDDYWRAPAQLKRVVIKGVSEWSTRKLMLQSGDADIAFVDRQFIDQVDGMEGVRLIKNQAQMALGYIMFNQEIKAEGNAFLGSGQLDGEGIPPDFFKDVDVRKGFSYLFDWETYIEQVLKGEGVQPKGPIPNGVPYYNPDAPTYEFNLDKATEHFQKAWDGQLWTQGFKFTALFNSGNESRKTSLEILRRNLKKINEKFEMEVINVEWPTFLSKSVEGSIPMFAAGWLEDYHDAHNWLFPLMHSEGTYGNRLGIGTRYDALIDQAISEFDPDKRQKLYYELQQMAYDDAVVIFREQRLGRHYQRDWVDGYYFNPIWPGRNYYVMSKKTGASPNMAYIEALNLEVEQW